MKDTKIQWHPGFVAAIALEFAENRGDLIYEKEYNLNTKPLEIDLLVIKKNKGVILDNEIGKFFRGHNIMEYKSPNDYLNIDTFYKAGAYASLYKSYGRMVDEIKAEDITVSIVRERKPEGLFRYFKEHGMTMANPHQGIYYVLDGVLFPTQIVVSKELKKENHIWLHALSEDMGRQDLRELLEKVSSIKGNYERELADSVLEVSIRANSGIAEKLRGDDNMCQALLELMEPEIMEIKRQIKEQVMQEGMQKGMQEGMQKGMQEGMQKGMQKGILGTVSTLRDLGLDNNSIKEAIIKTYQLSNSEAEGYL